jgi:hypothetical protein
MNALASLEVMGVSVSLAPGGRLALDGMKGLAPERREYALALAKANKPAIVEELLRSRLGSDWREWISGCDDYGEGCLGCEWAEWRVKFFCNKHPRFRVGRFRQ